RRQPYEILGRKFREPSAVKIHHGFFGTENPENLRLVSLSVLRNLLASQRRPCRRASRRIADHPGEISDEKDHSVSEILKVFELAQQNGVSQMQIRSRRIEARLHPQRVPRSQRAFELRAQF